MAKKCKACPVRRTCQDECYGENPCAFAVAFENLGKKLDRKEVCIESLTAERDAAVKKIPEHRIFGDYVLTPIPNAFNDKISWWISKRNCMKALYCFTASNPAEIEAQIRDGLDGYIKMFEYSNNHL